MEEVMEELKALKGRIRELEDRVEELEGASESE
jgi:hypothetical protein